MRLRTRDGGSRVMFIRCLGFTCVVLLLVAAVFSQESYDQLLHHWDYDKNTPLNIQQAGIEERGGVTIYDISFSSPVSDRSISVGPNGGTVTAYLIVPPGQGRFPAVIFGHWCMPGSEKKNRGGSAAGREPPPRCRPPSRAHGRRSKAPCLRWTQLRWFGRWLPQRHRKALQSLCHHGR